MIYGPRRVLALRDINRERDPSPSLLVVSLISLCFVRSIEFNSDYPSLLLLALSLDVERFSFSCCTDTGKSVARDLPIEIFLKMYTFLSWKLNFIIKGKVIVHSFVFYEPDNLFVFFFINCRSSRSLNLSFMDKFLFRLINKWNTSIWRKISLLRIWIKQIRLNCSWLCSTSCWTCLTRV